MRKLHSTKKHLKDQKWNHITHDLRLPIHKLRRLETVIYWYVVKNPILNPSYINPLQVFL